MIRAERTPRTADRGSGLIADGDHCFRRSVGHAEEESVDVERHDHRHPEGHEREVHHSGQWGRSHGADTALR